MAHAPFIPWRPTRLKDLSAIVVLQYGPAEFGFAFALIGGNSRELVDFDGSTLVRFQSLDDLTRPLLQNRCR